MKIALTRDKFALVDEEDYKILSQWKWKYMTNNSAARHVWDKENKRYYHVYMHRLIVDAPTSKVVDHINGDRLDNRRSNLRVCTQSQNLMNQKIRQDSESRLKGVYWHKQNNRWYARFRGKSLGSFDTKEEAADNYNKMAIKEYGAYARLN